VTATIEVSPERAAPPACLFENPYRPVSLADILRKIDAHAFSTLAFMLGQMHQLTKTATDENGPSDGAIRSLKDSIAACSGDIEALEFRSAQVISLSYYRCSTKLCTMRSTTRVAKAGHM
jgi:hypothetical protein